MQVPTLRRRKSKKDILENPQLNLGKNCTMQTITIPIKHSTFIVSNDINRERTLSANVNFAMPIHDFIK